MYPTSPRTVQGTTLRVNPHSFCQRGGGYPPWLPLFGAGAEPRLPPPFRQKRMVESGCAAFRRAVNRRAWREPGPTTRTAQRLRRAANPVASGPGTLSALACDYRCSVIYRCSENKKGCLTDIPTGAGPDNLGKNLTWKLGSDIYLRAVRLSS